MINRTSKPANRPAAIAGILLIAIAAITYWDASQMPARATYGINASATSYAVTLFLAMLGLCHLVSAFRTPAADVDNADWRAICWIALALAGLIGSIALGGGFVLGSALLFACTARAFGRRAFAIDISLGIGLSVAIFLFFTKLLTLALPQGPLERLF